MNLYFPFLQFDLIEFLIPYDNFLEKIVFSFERCYFIKDIIQIFS